jgi:hypothetical protein
VKRARPRPPGRGLAGAGLVTLALTALEAPVAAAANTPGLEACVTIAADAERLACYDKLAGRSGAAAAPQAAKSASPAATAVVVSPRTATSAATATAPVAAAAPASAAIAAAAPAAPAPAAAAPAAAPASAGAQSFGDYAAEHPKAASPATNSIEARVTGIGSSASGRVTVLLEGGALWELDQPDPLLAVGDTVTITRAALGSYMMRTSSQREHRVRRLR